MDSRRWKRLAVTLVMGILGFLGLGSWALASPIGAAPDDDYHLVSIWCAWGERDDLCLPGEVENEQEVQEQLVHAAYCYAYFPDQSAACEIPDDAYVSTARGNFFGEYPPLFYSVMSVFAGTDVAVSTILMRLLNGAIFVGVFGALLALLRPGQRGPLIWSAVITLVPLGIFIIPSVNPSSWAVLSGLFVWIATVGYFTAPTRKRRISLAALAIVLGVMGAGARGDAGAYLAFAGIVGSILTFRKDRDWVKLLWLPVVLIAVGAAMFLSSGQSAGAAGRVAAQSAASVQSAVISDGMDSAGSSTIRMLVENLVLLPSLWAGNLGTWGLGWIDTPMPSTVYIVMIGAFSAFVFWGISRMEWRKAVALTLALLALVIVPMYVLYGLQARVGEEVQPRYVLPLMLIFAGVALYGFRNDDLGLTRPQALVVLLSVAGANSIALHTNMRRYITGLDATGFNLNSGIEWWWSIPVQPMTVWFVGSAAFGLLLFGLYLLLFTERGRKLFPLSDTPSTPAVRREEVVPTQ